MALWKPETSYFLFLHDRRQRGPYGPMRPTFSASHALAKSGHCASGNRTAMSPDCVMYRTQGSEGYCSYSNRIVSITASSMTTSLQIFFCSADLRTPSYQSSAWGLPNILSCMKPSIRCTTRLGGASSPSVACSRQKASDVLWLHEPNSNETI